MLKNSAGKRDEWQFADARSTAGTAHMPICRGEDVEQDYCPVLGFLQLLCGRELSQECRSWVRVKKFQQDPTFNLIGRPRMKCGWAAGAKLTGRNMRALHDMPQTAGGIPQWRSPKEAVES